MGVRREHQNAEWLVSCAKSAIAEHVHDEESGTLLAVALDNMKVIDRAISQTERRVLPTFTENNV